MMQNRIGQSAVGVALMVACFALTARATTNITGTVDLAGETVTFYEPISGDGTFVNSSDRMASLVINITNSWGRVNFSGTISGNIKVIVQGWNSFQAFTSPCNTYTGGTEIKNGYLYVCTYDAIGTGPLYLSDSGRLVMSARNNAPDFTGTVNSVLTNTVVVTRTGRLGCYSDCSMTFAGGLVMTNATLELWNNGIFTWKTPFTDENARGGSLVLSEARVRMSPGVFGATPEDVPDMTLSVQRNSNNSSYIELDGTGELCLPKTTCSYRQNATDAAPFGSFLNEGNVAVRPGERGSLENWRSGSCVRFCRGLSVLSGAVTSSVPLVVFGSSAGASGVTVSEGATLAFRGLAVASSLQKAGNGRLALLGGVDAAHDVSVRGGVLELGEGTVLPEGVELSVSPTARLVLKDRSSVCATTLAKAVPRILSEANVWFDAAMLTGLSDGETVSTAPNLGTDGGDFVAGTKGGAPGLATYSQSGIQGLPALCVHNGDSGTPLGLYLTSYTNTATTITYFHVVQFDSWKGTGVNKWCTPCAMGPYDNASGTDLYDSNKGFQYRFNQDGRPNYAQIRSLGITDIWDYQSYWSGFGLPIVCQTRRNGNVGNHTLAWGGLSSGTATRRYEGYGTGSFNINYISLGAAAYCNGTAMTGRAFPGKIGEVIVFTRALSDDEVEEVNAYLRDKWLSSATESNRTAVSGQGGEVEVPTGANAALRAGFKTLDDASSGAWRKTGAGTLALAGSATNCTSVVVDEGTLALRRANIGGCAPVWFDAADAGTVLTDADGHVLRVRNKGTSGGFFERAAGTSSHPTLVEDAINGQGAVQFDFHSALTLNSWTNNSGAARNVHVYAVFRRTKYYLDPGSGTSYGQWGGPYSFYLSTRTGEDANIPGNFHYEERGESGVDSIAMWFGTDSSGLGTLGVERSVNRWVFLNRSYATGDAVLHVTHQMQRSTSTGFETVQDDSADVLLYATNAPSVNLSPFMVDLVMLGGRMADHGIAQDDLGGFWQNRMWHGQMGEFILMDHLPSEEEDEAIVAYLRKKWLGKGEASAEAPVCLRGIAEDFSEADSVAFEFAGGSALVQSAPTFDCASFVAPDGLSLLREDAATALAFFRAAGGVELGGWVDFACDSEIAENGALYSAASNDDTATWRVTVPGHPRARVSKHATGDRLLVSTGMVIYIR